MDGGYVHFMSIKSIWDIIYGACADETPLASFVQTPVSESSDINDFISYLTEVFNFQLFEFTLFKFPNEDYGKLGCWNIWRTNSLVTISCDIRITPKQELYEYTLMNAYGSCTNPPRFWESGNRRRKRSEAEETHLTISATQRISEKESYQQDSKEFIQQNSFTVSLISSVILLLIISV